MNTFYEELTASLDKLADIIDPDNSAEKPQTYNDSLVFSCQRIANHFKAGGALPEVTAEDDGDVLTVVDGEWGKAAPSGGGGGVIVIDTTELDTPSADGLSYGDSLGINAVIGGTEGALCQPDNADCYLLDFDDALYVFKGDITLETGDTLTLYMPAMYSPGSPAPSAVIHNGLGAVTEEPDPDGTILGLAETSDALILYSPLTERFIYFFKPSTSFIRFTHK